jgi:formylglycine-generating enzyme required for sulfatase activity
MWKIVYHASPRQGERTTIGMGIGFLAVVVTLSVAHLSLKESARIPNENDAKGSTAASENTRAIDSAQAAPVRSEPALPSGLPSHSIGDKWTDPVTGITFLWIPPGSFDMGSTKIEDANPVRNVKINKGFWLGQFEVTQAQWRAVMNNDPSSFKGDNLPVEQATCEEVNLFILKLNSMGQGGFRLPTEAEWEYACRAGTKSEFCYGDTLDSSQANFDGNYPYGVATKGVYREKTTVVGSFRPNAWGLYDMHGNVWELCSDWYDPDYYKSRQNPDNDPCGPSTGSFRVERGGAWRNVADECRSAARSRYVPGFRFNSIGFRLARSES